MSSDQEHIRNALISATAGIPMIGGPVSYLLDKYVPSEIEKRKIAFIDQLSQDIDKLTLSHQKTNVGTPSFISSFIKVFPRVLEEHRKEKIISYRNILINEAVSESHDFDELTFFIRLLSDLTVDQIHILHLVYRKQVQSSNEFGGVFNIYEEFRESHPKVEKFYLQACVTELIRYFLISSSSEVVEKNDGTGHFLTDFGLRFVSYIFEPTKFWPVLFY